MHEPDSRRVLKELNVDRAFVLALMKMFDEGGCDGFPIHGILEMLLACRADNPATVQTIAPMAATRQVRLPTLRLGAHALPLSETSACINGEFTCVNHDGGKIMIYQAQFRSTGS